MEEQILLDLVERYAKGEMSQDERIYFEEFRAKNPEIDQLVVEFTYFINCLENYDQQVAFRRSLKEIDAKFLAEGLIGKNKNTFVVKLNNFWIKYKRNIAVAASIAGFISIATSILVISYDKNFSHRNYTELVKIINKTQQEVEDIKRSKNSAVPKIEPKIEFGATGFLIDADGFLITNAHVISKMKNIYVENGRGEYFSAKPLLTDHNTDLALLKITDTAFSFLGKIPFSIKKTNVDLGEQFFTLGFPRQENEIVYGEGYVSAKSGNGGDSTAYQLTVSANPGNSGGPVINRNGEIIGVITAKDAKADGVVFAAKSSNIFDLIEQLKVTDPLFQSIRLPASKDLKKSDRIQQIKRMTDCVFMIVGN